MISVGPVSNGSLTMVSNYIKERNKEKAAGALTKFKEYTTNRGSGNGVMAKFNEYIASRTKIVGLITDFQA